MRELNEHLASQAEFAVEHAAVEQEHYAKYYNAHAAEKSFQAGEQVIVLEKDSSHKTFAKWQLGTVARILSPHSYLIDMPNGARRHLHANKIRKFIARTNSIGIVRETDVDFGPIETAPTDIVSDELPSQRIDRASLSHLDARQQAELLTVLDNFGDCFSETPGLCTLVEHEIPTVANFPARQSRAYRVPEALKAEIKRQVELLLAMGFIRKSQSPMSSGVVCVVKPDNSIRMACDYRYVNSYTVGDAYPMPNLTDTMHRVGRAKYISLCDAKSGYWQLVVRESDRWKTAFVTHHGLWEWIRMPFGLKCASNSFVRAVQAVLQPIKAFSDSYIDDMAIMSGRFSQHLTHLQAYLQVIRESGFKLNLRKCRFAQKQIVYVGHLIGGGQHRPDPAKLQAVAGMKPPTNRRQLRQVLGLLSYYRTYVKGYAEIAKPLTDLTSVKKSEQWHWGEREQLAFESLRQKVCEAPVLATVIPGRPFVLYTDASGVAVGCCLAQCNVEDEEHPVAYASQKLTPTQCSWATVEREAYAVVWALSRFRDMIFGSPITVYSDHNPLRYLMESMSSSAKLTRWALALQEYQLTLKYTKGINNSVADTLSRLEAK